MTAIGAREWVKRRSAAAMDRRTAGRSPGRAVILCYHSVHPKAVFSSATPELFAEHLAWLAAHVDVVPLTAIREPANGRPRVAITFDDGHADNWQHAFPALRRHGMTATFFLTTGLIERDEAVLGRFATTLLRCAREEVVPLSWGQVSEMQAGGVTFGAHTHTHPNLARLDAAGALAEMATSKAIVEEHIQDSVTALAYPFGRPRRHVSTAVVEAAAAAGFTQAVATASRGVRPSDPDLLLPRLFVTHDDVETLRQKVTGAWDYMGWWHERAPLWLVRLLRPGDESL